MTPGDSDALGRMAVRGSDLILIEGMGHDLPTGKGSWPQIVGAIIAHTKKAAG